MSKKGLFILAFAALAIYGAVSSKKGNASSTIASTASSKESKTADIHPKFKDVPGGIVMTNPSDPFGYTDIILTVNDDFTYKLPKLGQGGSVMIPWREFADEDGKRFSFLTNKVMNFKMTTTTTNGDFGVVMKGRQ